MSESFCNNHPNVCFYIGWCVFISICLIIYYLVNKGLSDEEYIIELKKINYNDKESAELKYKQIQSDIENYALSKITINCNSIYYSRSQYRACQSLINNEKDKFKQEYKKTKLTSNEQLLIKLYEKQHINNKITQYALTGYIIIPTIIYAVVYMPWWWWI